MSYSIYFNNQDDGGWEWINMSGEVGCITLEA